MPAALSPEKSAAIWSKFTYAELLDAFRKASDKAYAADDGLTEAYEYLARHEPDKTKRIKKPPSQATNSIRRTLTGKKTVIKKALGAVISLARSLSNIKEPRDISTWAAGFSDADGKLSLRYGQFDEFEKTTSNRLDLLLPELSPEDSGSWPSALSAQQTLSLFTQLCLRIHSEVPEEDPRKVMEVSIRMVIVPSLAFAIFQAGSANEPQEYAYKCLESLALGKSDLPSPSEFKSESEKRDSKLIARARNCIQNHAWGRLMEVLRSQAARRLGEESPRVFADECIRLLRTHIEHPHGSELWKALSKLSSTTPGANDLLVFEALKKLGHDHPSQVMRARLTCSRTRYKAIESGYYDSEFRAILNQEDAAIVSHVERHSSEWRTSEKLAKAFLLSRRCLVPSNSTAEDSLPRQLMMAALVADLLESCGEGSRHADEQRNPEIDLLAQRYLAGFLTNPRFVKHAGFSLGKAEAAIARYKKLSEDARNTSDIALSSLFEGRIAWAQMLASGNPARDTPAIFRHYGQSAKPLFSDDEEQVLDSEAPVWLLPELICLITLGDDLSNRMAYAEELRPRSGNVDPATLNLARTIQKVGERHYGIYFNLPAEVRRIRLGLLRMASVDIQAR